MKERDGRRNRYQLQPDLPLGNPVGREGTIGELLAWLLDEPGLREARPTRPTRPTGPTGQTVETVES